MFVPRSSQMRVMLKAKIHVGLTSLLASLSVASLSACGIENLLSSGPKATNDSLLPFTRLDKAFTYAAGGFGNDLDGNLVLIGPEETVRWNPKENRFERFGGPTKDVSEGRLLHDQAGTLHLLSQQAHYIMPKGTDTWKKLKSEVPEIPAGSGRHYFSGAPKIVLEHSGARMLSMRFTQPKEVTKPEAGVIFYRQASPDAPMVKLFEVLDKDPAKRGIGELDEFGMRKDGTLMYSNGNGKFAVEPGASEPQPMIDCSTIVGMGSYCNPALKLITDFASNDAYLVNLNSGDLTVWRIPSGKAFPVVPVALPTLPGVADKSHLVRFQIDSQNRLWGSVKKENAHIIDIPPYTQPVTTLSRLDGNSWKQVVRFVTPQFQWGQSADGQKLYGYGRQLVSGGFWHGWEVSQANL